MFFTRVIPYIYRSFLKIAQYIVLFLTVLEALWLQIWLPLIAQYKIHVCLMYTIPQILLI